MSNFQFNDVYLRLKTNTWWLLIQGTLMGSLLYLMLAYGAFWLISFGLIFSIFSRQRKLDQELASLKQLLDQQDDQ